MYDGHAVSLWWKSTRGVVADEPYSDSQGLHREVWARRKDSEIVAWRTETWYKAHMADDIVKISWHIFLKDFVSYAAAFSKS